MLLEMETRWLHRNLIRASLLPSRNIMVYAIHVRYAEWWWPGDR